MCFVVTCWERADLLALVCGVFCEFVTFPLVSWVRCGIWLYRFLIFATLLTLLDLGYWHLHVRIPNSWSIFFQLWSYKRIISPFTSLWHLCFDIASDKSKSPICISSYKVNMRIPGETTRDINPKIPGSLQKPVNVIRSQSSLSFWSLSYVPLDISRDWTSYPTLSPMPTVYLDHLGVLNCYHKV